MSGAAAAGHVLAVSLLGTGFAVLEFTGQEPNIGAGMLLIPLWLLGLPWTGLTSVTLPWDAVVVGGAALNAGLHVAVFAWRTRRQSAQERRPAAGRVLVLLFGAVILACWSVTTAVAVMSARYDEPLRREAASILPVAPWTAQGTDIPGRGCAFCGQLALVGQSAGLDGPSRGLQRAVDARLHQRGYQAGFGWSCSQLDDGLVEDPEEAEAVRTGPDRLCFRDYQKEGYSAFLRIYDKDRRNAELWLDLVRQ